MSNLVFDSLNIAAAFSMFLCFLSEVVTYLFYYKRPTTKVNWWIQLKHIPHQEQKKEREKRLQHRCFRVNFAKFLRTRFFKSTYGGCIWRWARRNQTSAHGIPIEQTFSLNDLFSIILATRRNGHVAGQKLKWSKTKWKNLFLYSFWKAQPRGRCNRTQCTPSVTSLIFRRTIFLCHILTTFIIQKIHKRSINHWLM